MKTNVQNQTNDLIQYLSDGTIRVLLKNILTLNQEIYSGMTGIIIKGSDIEAIEIQHIWNYGNHLYIKTKNLRSGFENLYFQELDAENDDFTWILVSFAYIVRYNVSKKYQGMVDELLEFEF